LSNLAKGETTTIKIKAILLPSGNDGSFSFEAKSDTKYKIVVIAPGYLKEETEIKTVNDTDVDPLEMSVSLAQELRVVDEKIMININTIYFDFDKWNIRPEAAKELDKVIAVMKEHPSMMIEGGSHTDSRAREAYNQKLSEKRARSTVDYIVTGGIDRSRIASKGYGEMQLVNNCSSFVKCSREEHQLNRRTEFVIVNDNDRFTSNAATLENVKIDKKANLTFVEVESDITKNKTFGTGDISPNDINVEKSTVTESETISIPPIYFDFDKWSISDSELKQLDNVVQIMKDNPTIVVEAGSHTDSKNLESYNQLLSEKRARSVVRYIVSKGVSSDRIIGKGYGEMRLTNHCKSFVKCTPEEQQANRRTEFKIIK
jgi:outer membrane protein OmpA-like peptidoglycan-associated protein